jgi:hypothetical protein
MAKAGAVAGVLALVAAAFAAGWVAGASRDVPAPVDVPRPASPARADAVQRPSRAEAREIAELRGAVEEARKAGEPPAPPQRADAAELLAKRLGESVDTATQAALRDRAERLRNTYLRQAEAAELSVAAQAVQSIRKERAERDDRLRGGTMAWLKGLEDKWSPPWELLRAPHQFDALFARQTSGPTIDGPTLVYDRPPADGTTIRFPAGRFVLGAQAMRNRWKPFPKDLAIQGAGMDVTLLVLDQDLEIDADVHCLTLRDLTIHAADHYLTELRDTPFTIRAERVRIVGFDMGAGGSTMVAGTVGAFFATDCRIEAGFGRSPGSGNLFDVRGAFVARLENCDVVGPFSSVFCSGDAATTFHRCRFTRMPDPARVGHMGDVVEFVDCTFEGLSADELKSARKAKPRPITELNPAWADAKKR